MKEIVEEWKTIEDYPNYEISNMGRCRNKKSGILKKPTRVLREREKNNLLIYQLHRNNAMMSYTVGMLVARHFIPNPNGYKLIRYKDGNPGNACYWNIEWILTVETNVGRRRTKKTREEQIEDYRISRDRIDRIIKYLENDEIGDLINDEFLPVIKKTAEKRLPHDKIEEFVSYATEYFADVLSRGQSIIRIENIVKHVFFRFYRSMFGKKTVSLDEARVRDNEKEII